MEVKNVENSGCFQLNHSLNCFTVDADRHIKTGLKGVFRRLRRQAFNIRNNYTCGIWGDTGRWRAKEGEGAKMFPQNPETLKS